MHGPFPKRQVTYVHISYPMKFTIVNTPLALQARQFGKTALWQPGTNLSNVNSFSPSFSGAADQMYTVAIKKASGCLTTDTQFVKIISHVDIYVPNAFTPNADGKNDVLRPLLRGIKELHYFKVFNRVGQLLFETHSEYAGWNGFINGHAQQTQAVVWVVEGVGGDDKLYKRTGTTVLVRQ